MTAKIRKKSTQKTLGLKLYWHSPVFDRERHGTQWYESDTNRDIAMKKFAAERIQGKPRYTRIEKVER